MRQNLKGLNVIIEVIFSVLYHFPFSPILIGEVKIDDFIIMLPSVIIDVKPLQKKFWNMTLVLRSILNTP